MARYTGPAYKKSRRLGFSTLENGKELAKRPYAPVNCKICLQVGRKSK